jgi:hypothetical protein
MKVQHTFAAPTRRTTADSSNKTPDAIIRAPTAVDPGTYIERNVRLALTCDYNAFQKKSKLQTGYKFLFYLVVTYIYSTHVLVGPADKMSLLTYRPPSDKYELTFEVTTLSGWANRCHQT